MTIVIAPIDLGYGTDEWLLLVVLSCPVDGYTAILDYSLN